MTIPNEGALTGWRRVRWWAVRLGGVLLVTLFHLAAALLAFTSWVGENRPYGDSESERAAIVAVLSLLLEAVAALVTAFLLRLPAEPPAWWRWAYLPVAVIVAVAVVGISWGPLYLITP